MGQREPPAGEAALPPQMSGNPDYFRRVDESDDRDFYIMPRLVIHVDEHGSAALTEFYGRVLKSSARVLDLMSAYRSHLPVEGEYARIVGLGMNVTELLENTALRGGVVQDLNRLPALPFADDSFDACLISFSIQYLTQPVRVLADVARVLLPAAPFTSPIPTACSPPRRWPSGELARMLSGPSLSVATSPKRGATPTSRPSGWWKEAPASIPCTWSR